MDDSKSNHGQDPTSRPRVALGWRILAGRVASPLLQLAKNGFNAQYWGVVDRFEIVDRDGILLHRLDHDGMQPDWVGTIDRLTGS